MKVEELEAELRRELEGIEWLQGTILKSVPKLAEAKREKIATHRNHIAKLCSKYLETHGASTSSTHRSLPPVQMDGDDVQRPEQNFQRSVEETTSQSQGESAGVGSSSSA